MDGSGAGKSLTTMRRLISPQSESHPTRSKCLRPLRSSLVPALALALLASCALLPAQTPTQQTPAATPTQQPVHHRHPKPTPKQEIPPPVAPVPVTPPEPEQPKWPAFDPAAQASVVWDSHGLKIDAANSSLQQILKEVATDTGVKVDGLSTDERVFGTYGPGQARDVLSQLLQGSGYNVMMVGDQGGGTPRQVLLSTRQAATNQPAARSNPTSNDDDEVEEQPQAQEPPPGRPQFPPGAQQRSPGQIMQEMQQRQQQMQQQQPQQQPQQPQQPN
jgi:hypothetical protein